MYQQAEQIIVNDAVWVPLFVGDNYWLTKPYVKGPQANAFNDPYWNELSIAQH